MSKTRLIHISAVDPDTGGGGVEQFARDLRDAVGDVKFISYAAKSGSTPWGWSRISNEKAIDSGEITKDDIVIADGFYGFGLEGKVKRLISVCHGSYVGMLREYEMNPPPSYSKSREWIVSAAQAQEEMYRNSEVVSVSVTAAEELQSIYGIHSRIIRNGVDTNVYKPADGRGLVEVAGSNERKGSDIIARLGREGYEINRLGFDGEKHARWQKFGIAVLPSRYEGGQYAALEAMSCGLTVVAYRSGFFRSDVPRNLFYGTFDYYWRAFAFAIDDAYDNPVSAREWVKENASIELFRKEWRKYLGVE